MSRFFKKAKNIEAITQEEVDEFIYEEKVAGKVMPDRVKDFYNSLSRVLAGEDIEQEEEVNYNMFNCKTLEDEQKIDALKEDEYDFVNSIRREVLTEGRLLKAATALAYKFESDRRGNRPDITCSDPNEYLRHLFAHENEELCEQGDEPAPFGDLLDIDVQFMKYLALLSNKKAFAKAEGKKVKDSAGKSIRYTPMDNFEEIYGMDLIEIALPGYDRKLVDKDLYVRSRFSNQSRAQNLIILIDDSGSMNHPIKKGMLRAALHLKMRDHSDVHNIYIGTFERTVYGFKKMEKGMKFEDLDFIRLGGGTTCVNECIMKTIEGIRKRELRSFGGGTYSLSDDHFEIMVINDGQDAVDKKYHPTIKIHALCLIQSNPDLKNICHRSGGTYHYLTAD